MGSTSNWIDGGVTRRALIAAVLVAVPLGALSIRSYADLGMATSEIGHGEVVANARSTLSFGHAVSYYRGSGVRRDYAQALGWYVRASREGFPVAKHRLDEWDVREDRKHVDTTGPLQTEAAAVPIDLPLAEKPLGRFDAPAVKRLQATLTRKGYDPGPIDGIMGPKTRAAFERFQEAEANRQDAMALSGDQADS